MMSHTDFETSKPKRIKVERGLALHRRKCTRVYIPDTGLPITNVADHKTNVFSVFGTLFVFFSVYFIGASSYTGLKDSS